jgi:hypothetical protein
VFDEDAFALGLELALALALGKCLEVVGLELVFDIGLWYE